jgi:hypothetical protein
MNDGGSFSAFKSNSHCQVQENQQTEKTEGKINAKAQEGTLILFKYCFFREIWNP